MLEKIVSDQHLLPWVSFVFLFQMLSDGLIEQFWTFHQNCFKDLHLAAFQGTLRLTGTLTEHPIPKFYLLFRYVIEWVDCNNNLISG